MGALGGHGVQEIARRLVGEPLEAEALERVLLAVAELDLQDGDVLLQELVLHWHAITKAKEIRIQGGSSKAAPPGSWTPTRRAFSLAVAISFALGYVAGARAK